MNGGRTKLWFCGRHMKFMFARRGTTQMRFLVGTIPKQMKVLRVCRNGAIRWFSHNWLTVSTTLIERYIGFEEFSDGLYRVYYRNKLLGYFNERTLRIIDGQGSISRRNKKCKRCA